MWYMQQSDSLNKNRTIKTRTGSPLQDYGKEEIRHSCNWKIIWISWAIYCYVFGFSLNTQTLKNLKELKKYCNTPHTALRNYQNCNMW